MGMLFDAGRILSTPLGSLVYHLLLLLGVLAILGMAWEEGRRARRGEDRRLLLAAGGLVLARLIHVGAALAVTTGWLDRTVLLPPLERMIDTASLGLLAWVLFPAPSARWRARPLNLLLIANLAGAFVVGTVLTVLWGRALAERPDLDYNITWQAAVWGIWQVALAAAAAVAAARGRSEGRIRFLVAMVVVAAGTVAQTVSPSVALHLPIWTRAANLVAYPLLVIAVYQSVVSGLRLHSRELQDISQASMDQIKSLLFLFEAGREMSSSLDLPAVLENAVQGIARALDADQCAIAFPQESDPGQMRLAAIYNPARQGRGEGVTFPLDYQLNVRQAMRRKRYLNVEDADNVQLKVLFALLGSSEVGPLLIQPLVADNEAIGAIIVGNGRSRRAFTPNETKLCQSMADQVVIAIQNARRFRTIEARIDELNRTLAEERRAALQSKTLAQESADRLAAIQVSTEELRRREEAAREARNALEIRLVSSRAESEALTERLSALESDLAQTHANAEAQLAWHRNELARKEAAWHEAVQGQDRIQSILNGLTAGILIATADGRIQESNVAAEILLDCEADQLKGQSLRSVNDDPRWQQAIATAAGGEAVRLTLPVGSNSLLCDVAPIPNPDGDEDQADGIVVVMQDISAELEEQQARLQQVAAQAEELKGSVATVSNYANLMQSEVSAGPGAQSKFLLRLRAGMERIAQAVDDLTRLAGGVTRPSILQIVDVNQVIQAAVAESQSCLKDKNLTVDLSLPDGLPTVEADPERLRQVLTHLLLNAYLASPMGARIEVRSSHTEGTVTAPDVLITNGDRFVVVSVRDSGGGLPHEALGNVFDRARPVRTPQGLGASGADLAQVRSLVEAQHGHVWVETEKGVGTTFSFALLAEGRA